MMEETQERFLRAIAERIAPERVVEVHLFSAIRQGPSESRVAVIAAEPEVAADVESVDIESANVAASDVETPVADSPAVTPPDSPSDGAPPDAPDDSYIETDEPIASAEERPAMPEPEGAPANDSPASRRLTIYRAQYRLVLKGADRGTWDVNITAEADAPIETVDEVVRGVRRRAGEDAEPERLTGSAFRAVLSSEPWTATP